MMQNFKRSQKGFTLVELMVVVAIIGILAAIAVPKFTDAADTSKAAKIQADLRTIGSAVAIYYSKEAKNPDNLQALVNANLLAAVPEPPKGATGLDNGAYSYSNGVASAVFGGKIYKSDGTVNNANP